MVRSNYALISSASNLHRVYRIEVLNAPSDVDLREKKSFISPSNKPLAAFVLPRILSKRCYIGQDSWRAKWDARRPRVHRCQFECIQSLRHGIACPFLLTNCCPGESSSQIPKTFLSTWIYHHERDLPSCCLPPLDLSFPFSLPPLP